MFCTKRTVITFGVELDFQPQFAHSHNLLGIAPLHSASKMSARGVKILLDAGADPNLLDNFGRSPLLFSSDREGWPDVVKMLIEAGADVNCISSRGDTPLHKAIYSEESKSLVARLLEAGADPTIRNADGQTPEDMVVCYPFQMCPHSLDDSSSVKKMLIIAREAWELASVAAEGRSEGRAGRRRI